MNELLKNHRQVISRIKAACTRNGRAVMPLLLAVSKKHKVDKIKYLTGIGQRDFGESYVQEAIKKIIELEQLSVDSSLIWHFIGPIQSNKAKQIATYFSWVHSVDRLKILGMLDQYRQSGMNIGAPLNVLLQLKIGDEASKSGASREEVLNMAAASQKMKNLMLRGVMCIPPRSTDFVVQSTYFRQAKDLYDELVKRYSSVDTLSMGMSNDLEAAIYSGSTMVRVGTDIFGVRG